LGLGVHAQQKKMRYLRHLSIKCNILKNVENIIISKNV
jgi:hypothetical protein